MPTMTLKVRTLSIYGVVLFLMGVGFVLTYVYGFLPYEVWKVYTTCFVRGSETVPVYGELQVEGYRFKTTSNLGDEGVDVVVPEGKEVTVRVTTLGGGRIQTTVYGWDLQNTWPLRITEVGRYLIKGVLIEPYFPYGGDIILIYPFCPGGPRVQVVFS